MHPSESAEIIWGRDPKVNISAVESLDRRSPGVFGKLFWKGLKFVGSSTVYTCTGMMMYLRVD